MRYRATHLPMRQWAWLAVMMLAGLAHADREYAFGGPEPKPVEPEVLPRFASGSVVGPWTFQEAGAFLGTGTFADFDTFGSAGFATNLTVGWGFEAGPVHLRPAARFALSYDFVMPDAELGRRLGLTPIALTLAANNLLDDPVTGLRLTPIVGLTVPTSGDPALPLTFLSVALQLERRFGPVEFALRTRGSKSVYGQPPGFMASSRTEATWANTLLVEGWITPRLSLGASLAWNLGFSLSAAGTGATGPLIARHLTVGRVFFSWAFARLFGLTFEVETTQNPLHLDGRSVRFPFLSFGAWETNATVLLLGLWFRSDFTLQRNWLER